MPDPVIVTRPLAQALGMAKRLTEAGYRVNVFPLLEIHPVSDLAPLRDALSRLEQFALVAFVSPNAIDASFGELKQWPRSVPLAVMGEGSRRALAQHGVTDEHFDITSPHNRERTDSLTLLEALDIDKLRRQQVLILRGEAGRELLADALRAAGAEVEQVAAYRRLAPTATPARMQQLREFLQVPHDWIITSSEALRILMHQVEHCEPGSGVVKLRQQKLYVPHERIAETARLLGFTAVFLTAAGDEGLLTALQSSP